MGIDIYMRWKGQTTSEEKAQYTGFSATAGNVGYLREAYHGGPYATRVLVQEAFEESDDVRDTDESGVKIPAKVLRSRLPSVIDTVIERMRKVYKEKIKTTDPMVKAYIDFVELAEKKERETGEPVRIIASY